MVPVERIELPTFGLQNRCTTAVLHRHSVLTAIRVGQEPRGFALGIIAPAPRPSLSSARSEPAEALAWHRLAGALLEPDDAAGRLQRLEVERLIGSELDIDPVNGRAARA